MISLMYRIDETKILKGEQHMSMSSLKKFTAAVIAVASIFSVTACGKTDDNKPATKITQITTTQSSIPIDPTTTTTLYIFKGTLPPNDEEMTWTETALPAQIVKIVKINSDFLKVRKGPGTNYDQVASLTKDMQVICVARTGNQWYKLDSGYYVSGEYLKDA